MTQSVALSRPTGSAGVATRIARTFGAIIVATFEANSRQRAVRHLQAKSDAELADIGLRRADIARRVFGAMY